MSTKVSKLEVNGLFKKLIIVVYNLPYEAAGKLNQVCR